jgi:hypothetical protein
MRYIKKFEKVEGLPTKGFPIDVTLVTIGSSGDPVYALYINYELHVEGDDYHDKFNRYVDGFVDGLKWSGVNVNYEEYEINEGEWVERCCELGDSPPNNLEDIVFLNEELIGVRRFLRGLSHENEIDAEDIKYNLENKKYSNLKFNTKRGSKDEIISTFTFNIDDKLIKLEENNYFPFFKKKFRGTTEYLMFIDNNILECSNHISKEIYKIAEKLYKRSKS